MTELHLEWARSPSANYEKPFFGLWQSWTHSEKCCPGLNSSWVDPLSPLPSIPHSISSTLIAIKGKARQNHSQERQTDKTWRSGEVLASTPHPTLPHWVIRKQKNTSQGRGGPRQWKWLAHGNTSKERPWKEKKKKEEEVIQEKKP